MDTPNLTASNAKYPRAWILVFGIAVFAPLSPGQPNSQARATAIGLATDWTHRRVVFTNSGSPQVLRPFRKIPGIGSNCSGEARASSSQLLRHRLRRPKGWI